MKVETLLELKRAYAQSTGLDANTAFVNSDDYEDLREMGVGHGPMLIAGLRIIEAPEITQPILSYVIKS